MSNDDLILCAFRYVIGCSSHLVVDMTQHLIEWWPSIGEKTQDIIVEEILDALDKDKAGDSVDQDMWMDVLANVDENYLDDVNKNCKACSSWWTGPLC